MSAKNKRCSVRRVLAIIALAAIVIFVAAGCVCMILGNKEMMMASLFCLVFVPIIIYMLIAVYDAVHREEKHIEELFEEDVCSEEGKEVTNSLDGEE